MISMDFLTKHKVGGLEFIEFQNTDFYKKLSDFLEGHIDDKGVLDPASHSGILEIVAQYTGFSNISIIKGETGNLGVDVAYFSPKHVFNSELAETLLKKTESTLYRWFTENKDKVFKGTIDYTTGKVGGSFATLPVKLYINHNLNVCFPKEAVGKYGVSLAGILTGAIAHECGHLFGGCMMLLTNCSDNLLAKVALRKYKDSHNESDRVVVLQDIGSLLDLKKEKVEDLQRLAKSEDERTVVLYFNKLLTQRNTRRSLSVGVERMSSEVVADMYAIRMGCSKGIIAAIGVLVDRGCVRIVLDAFYMAAIQTIIVGIAALPAIITGLLAGMSGALAIGGLVICIVLTIVNYFSNGYSGVYNAGHRRFDDALRQLIGRLKEDKHLSSSDRVELVKEIEQLLEINEKLKPWYDSLITHRFFGWMFSGGDFRAAEMEHYTNVLANHEINLLSSKLKTLA